jgi:hypothetical protein
MNTDHYEVELRAIAYTDDGNGLLQITGESWRPVRVGRSDNITKPLVFGSLDEACSYAGRDRPGLVRIVRVTDEGEREVVETGCL